MDTMFKLMEQRFVIDGTLLRRRRKELDMTLKRFGFLCGWSFSYQWNLENVTETVNESTKKVILGVLEKES